MQEISDIPICISPTGGWGDPANEPRYQAWGAELLKFWNKFKQGERYTNQVSRVETRFYSEERAVCWMDGKGHFSHKYVRVDPTTLKKVETDDRGIELRSDQIVEREQLAVELTQKATATRYVLLASLIGVKALWYLGDVKVSLIGGPLTPFQWGVVAGLLELQMDSPGPWILLPALVHTFASGQRILGLDGLLIGGSLGALLGGSITYQLHREPRRLLTEAHSLREASSMEYGVPMWSAIQYNLLSRLWALRENGHTDRDDLRKDVRAFLENQREIEGTYGLLFSDPERDSFEHLLRFCRRIERFLSIKDDTTQEIQRARLRTLAMGDKRIPLTTPAWHRRLLETISQLRRGRDQEQLARAVEVAEEAFDNTLITQVERMQVTIGKESWLQFLLEIHERRTIPTRIGSLIGDDPTDDLEASLKRAPCLVVREDDDAETLQLKRERLAELDHTPGLHEKVCKVEQWSNSRNDIANPLQHLERELGVVGQGLDAVQKQLDVDGVDTRRGKVLQTFSEQFGKLVSAAADSAHYQYTLDQLTRELHVVHAAERAGNDMGNRGTVLGARLEAVAKVDMKKIDVYEEVRVAMEHARHILALQQWVREGADLATMPERKSHETIDGYQAGLAWTVAKYFEDDERYQRFNFKEQLRQVEAGLIAPDTFSRFVTNVCTGMDPSHDDLWLAAQLFYVDKPKPAGERPPRYA